MAYSYSYSYSWLAKNKKFCLKLICRFFAWLKGYDSMTNEGGLNDPILHSRESMEDVISHAN